MTNRKGIAEGWKKIFNLSVSSSRLRTLTGFYKVCPLYGSLQGEEDLNVATKT